MCICHGGAPEEERSLWAGWRRLIEGFCAAPSMYREAWGWESGEGDPEVIQMCHSQSF